jgi:hypothetical protein
MPVGPLPLPGNPLSVSVLLNGSGNGSVSIGPQRVREHWQVQSVAVSVAFPANQDKPTNESKCAVNVGSPPATPGNFYGQTPTGSTGDTCSVGTEILTGQLIIVTWTGGDPGELATAVITGTYTIGEAVA